MGRIRSMTSMNGATATLFVSVLLFGLIPSSVYNFLVIKMVPCTMYMRQNGGDILSNTKLNTLTQTIRNMECKMMATENKSNWIIHPLHIIIWNEDNSANVHTRAPRCRIEQKFERNYFSRYARSLFNKRWHLITATTLKPFCQTMRGFVCCFLHSMIFR